jgi:hypothetical protein
MIEHDTKAAMLRCSRSLRMTSKRNPQEVTRDFTLCIEISHDGNPFVSEVVLVLGGKKPTRMVVHGIDALDALTLAMKKVEQTVIALEQTYDIEVSGRKFDAVTSSVFYGRFLTVAPRP